MIGLPHSLPNSSMIKVYFDGKCGLCSKEINYYQRIVPEGVFEWLDIATDPSLLEGLGISHCEALKRLHVQDSAGTIKTGINAFQVIWEQLPNWRILGRITRVPGIYHFVEYLYVFFADYRFERLDHCKAIDDQ